MADEVSVCDVLCEAMEYLSKLGSNLRTRSEAMKEKKITKDKLKNAHAVQKAANKVLLICQLSKKSLENVENGVKKILTQVDASQASACVGGKTSSGDKKTDYQYFEYKSRKLKIAKKVPIKHFMSAKVMARSMPISMQDKYKVFYDCKLYRLRKRKALKESFNRRERPDKHSPKRDGAHERGETSSQEPISHESRKTERTSFSKKNRDEDLPGSQSDADILRPKDNDSQTQNDLGIKARSESNSDSIEPDSLNILANSSDNNDIADKGQRKVHEKSFKKDTTQKKDTEISALELESLEKESPSKKNKDKDSHSASKDSLRSKDGDKHVSSTKNIDTKIVSYSDDSCENTNEHDKSKNKYSEIKSRDSKEIVADSDSNEIDAIKHKSNNSGDKKNKSDKKNGNKFDSSDSNTTTSKASEMPGMKNFNKKEVEKSSKQLKNFNEEGTEVSNKKGRDSIDASSESEKCNTSKSESKREEKHSVSDKTSNKVEKITTIKLNKSHTNCDSSVSSDSDSPKSSRSKAEKLKYKSNNKKYIKYISSDSDTTENAPKKSESRKKHSDSKWTIKSYKRRNSCISSDTDEDLQKPKKEKDKTSKNVIEVIEDSDSGKEELHEAKVSVNQKQVIDLEDHNDGDKERKSGEPSKDPESEPQKPLIKLVNINKLLKPDILQKDSQLTKPPVIEPQNKENEFGTKSRGSIKDSAMRSINKNDNTRQKFKKVRYEDEENFWAPKRKEVAAFKPKNFTINIIRVKKVSKLLHKHSLSKITHCGSIVCELKDKYLTTIDSQKGEDTTDKEAVQVSDMGTVKKALLVDSDSDKSESTSKNLTYDTEKDKNTFLDESDSGKNDDQDSNINLQTAAKKISESEKSKEYETVKNILLDESDSERNDEQHSKILQASYKNNKSKGSLKDYKTVKNTLLDDSDSEKNDVDDSSPAVTKNKNFKGGYEDDKSDSGKSDEQNSESQRTTYQKNNQSKMRSNNNYEIDTAKTRLLHDSDSEKRDEEDSGKGLPTTKVHKNKTSNDQLDGSVLENIDDHDSGKYLQTNDKISKYGTETENVQTGQSDYSDSARNNEKGQNNLETAIEDKNSVVNDETDNAKNNLLDDSDSEKSDEKISDKELKESDENISKKKCEYKSRNENVENVKIDLLDSDSDNNDKEECNKHLQTKKNKSIISNEVEETEIVKYNLLQDSDSEKNNKGGNTLDALSNVQEKNNRTPDKEIPPTNEDPDNVKSSLLNDSSDDISKKSDKRNRKCSGSTPHSKRKHIMESMHAKKMLLTYSSSSGTEDENLKDVFKEIKESLLKGISSDEEKQSKETHRRKLYTSSDSDEDILKRVKKRKVRSKRSPSKEVRELKENNNEASEEVTNEQSNIDQIDGTIDETSNSSKMGRSREKRGGSSSHNSDNQEEKDVDGLTNLATLNKSHRRPSSSKNTASTSSKQTLKAAPLITGEGLLEAPSSSDEASAADSDVVDDDLPPVTLSGVNGGAIGHIGKDALLGDSDSSASSGEKDKDDSSNEKEDDEDAKQDNESDTEKNMKSKRRKAHAISSDSEAGSSRPKESNRAASGSDFEDSGEESEPVKKSKRKKKASDSDASGGSSNEGSKKKRRRIKQIDDSDASGSDSENEGKKHGRKNIRKVMGKNQLEEATKRAARQEKERIARIADRQKMYNNLEFDESGKPDEVVLDKVVLDFDPETKEPLIEVDRGLVKKLKPHQANGIKFMWDACFESVKRIKKDRGSGCILAHCMGLGKTLQVVSLTHTLLTHSELTNVHRVLVVCPLSTVLNWVNEYRMWLKYADKDYEVDVYELSKYKQNSERAFQLSQWFEHGGVCVLGYEMFRNLSADNNKKFKKKMLRNFQESLVDPGPDMVVCDEGHLLKNEKTSLSQSMNRVRTYRRIVLTGTPLQNNLKEYYCMVQFVKPNLLGKYNEYLNRFVNPITNGQYTDSTEHDIRIMKRRSHVLHTMLDGAVQRRDYGVLAPFLPPKHEYVLFITLTEVQIKLYQHYLDNYSRRPLPGKSSGFLFPDFQSLQRIWTHPLVLKYNSERYEIMQQKKRDKEEEDSEGSLADFIDDDTSPEDTSSDEPSDDSSDVSDDSRKKSKKKKSAKKKKASTRRATRANPVELAEEEDVMEISEVTEVKNDNPTEWWIPMVTDDEVEDIRNSNKLVLLFEILRQCEAIGDKLLVFSQSLYSLDLIEHFLGKVDEATQEGRIDEKLGGHVGSWSPGVDYFRLDGSTSCENRSIWCKNFNREDNPRARLFLISTRAGGLGINLVAANRVIIFDVSWNPSHDVQSIFRVYRFGQKKPCYVYRFLVMGTMEEKIYERQVTKQAISKRVIDEQQIDRHYAENDLAELYRFEPRQPEPRPVPLVPKDRLFAEMLKDHENSIYKFHEHDSLLENKEEETLSEEERKAAWEDFENEKNRPPPAPFANPWPMHNGMVPNLLAQQQQQLAYAALATMLRKDMPNLSDDQVRGMLPLIYGANPGLMQKLGDIYKYPQPSMMNPAAMMNSVMNPGGGVGMGGGGTSGLQYEPPWARDQRDQQNHRLQQLLQQQNQMGAKFYAGGLGSRDPVAMALQQQRAREIMLGDAARQRGRPPLQPRRAPPAAPAGDVVNLADSD